MRSHWKSAFLFAFLALGLCLAACGDSSTADVALDATPEAAAAAGTNAEAPDSVQDGGSALMDPTAAAGATGTSGATGAEKCSGSGSCSKTGGDCSKTDCSKTDCSQSDCSSSKTKPASDAPACVCAQGKAGSPVWCNSCDKGYVDGKEVCCPKCVKAALKKQAKAGTQ